MSASQEVFPDVVLVRVRSGCIHISSNTNPTRYRGRTYDRMRCGVLARIDDQNTVEVFSPDKAVGLWLRNQCARCRIKYAKSKTEG